MYSSQVQLSQGFHKVVRYASVQADHTSVNFRLILIMQRISEYNSIYRLPVIHISSSGQHRKWRFFVSLIKLAKQFNNENTFSNIQSYVIIRCIDFVILILFVFSRSKYRPWLFLLRDKLPSRRIFHLNANVIKTCFEVLRVVFGLLIKNHELHPQLLVFYVPHLLQGEGWGTGEGMKIQGGEWQKECDNQNIFLVCTVERILFFPAWMSAWSSKAVQMCLDGQSLWQRDQESVFCTVSSSLSPILSSSERIWTLKSNSSPRLIKALISCMQPPCQKNIIKSASQFRLIG